MSLNLFIIGPSGCGKSTQAKLIAEKYNLNHFSTGQLLRDEVSSQSELGIKIKEYQDKGIWVPDETTCSILESNLNKINNQNFIIDGFPRMLNQGLMIEEYLKSNNSFLSSIILLDVTFDEIISRRQKQREQGIENFSASGARSDETPEAIAQRQKSYDESINPIIDHFSNTNQLIKIDGNRPIEPIFTDICQMIDKLTINN